MRLKVLMIGLILLLLIESGALYYIVAFRLNRPLGPAPVSTQPNSAATIQALQATLTAVANPEEIYTRATSSPLVLNDQLNESDSDITDWYKGSGDGYSCGFAGGAYHASSTRTNWVGWCINQSTNYSDFAYQVQMKVIKGDGGGIIFRSNLAMFKGYEFYLDRNGTYTLYLREGHTGDHDQILRSKSSSLIKTGLNETNVITVVASGNNIYLYVNKQYLTSLSENSYNSGQIGLLAESDQSPPTDVVFSNVQVWKV